MEEKKYKKGDNPKGQGPCKPKKEKTKEKKEAARAKQAEKKRLKKEQARKEEEEKKKKEEEEKKKKEEEHNKDETNEKKNEDKNEKNEDKKEINEDKKEKIEDKKEEKSKKKEGKKKGGKKEEKKEEKKDEEKTKKDNEENKDNKKKEVKKDSKKKLVKFYGITSFEERNEELKLTSNQKEDNKSSILSSYEIISYLSNKVKYSKVNEEIINSIRNIFLCGSTKQAKNCLYLLNSIKLFVDSVEGDYFNICDEVSSLIYKVNNLIAEFLGKCSGLFNTCKYLQQIADLLSTYPSYKENELKELIKIKIQYFIDRRIKKIDDINLVEDIIQDGDTILLFGKSKIFRKLLWQAKENKIKFSVIFVDSPKRSQISSEIKFLSKLGIPIKYTYIKGVSNLMSEVTKVFIKADSILFNGDLIGKPGTSLLSLIAKTFNKSVYAFCSSFKFMDNIIISNNPKIVKKEGYSCNEMVFDFNITPSSLIKAVICENGYIHASSIPVYIKELEKNDKLFINS